MCSQGSASMEEKNTDTDTRKLNSEKAAEGTSPQPKKTTEMTVSLVTPPSSTTFKKMGGDRPDLSYVELGSPSFSSRRECKKPRPLDIEALRRERQYSGPFSANPLLSKKRRLDNTSDHENNRDENDGLSPKLVRRRERRDKLWSASTTSQLPKMKDAPFTARSVSQEPLHPPPGIPAISAPPYGSIFGGHMPKNMRMPSGKSTPRSSAFQAEGMLGQPMLLASESKKSRFLDLCSQIWDLIEERR